MPATCRRAFVFLATVCLVASGLSAVAFPPAPPDDPQFEPDGPCPEAGFSCATPTGQWNLLSYSANFPPVPHASGISADLAWSATTGRPDTVVMILDSGVNYDHVDLRNKIWLNRGELPVPDGAACNPPVDDPHDCNGDGVFNVQDFAGDSRLTDTILPGVLSRSDLRVFEDGIDTDSNGFIDDISGWDADDDDGDEYDHRDFGHGTGRNGFIGAETDNGIGIAGICPDCPLTNVRVDDTFVHKTEGAAKGAVWAADHGHSVITMALGATGASSATRAAFDYATRKNVLAVSASANEFSFHHNFQTQFDDVMAIGAVVPDNEELVTTYLRKANFSNYGAKLDVVAPSDSPTTSQGGGFGDSSGTSSAVPHAAGVAALVFSRARELIEASVLDASGLALQDISAQEVRQIIDRTADDVVIADDPSGPYTNHLAEGWDRYTGYGRMNAKSAVDMVAPGTIPPEADINSPDWFTYVDGTAAVAFYANARWTDSFDVVLEVGQGVQPTTWTPLLAADDQMSNPALSSASMASNFSFDWDTTALTPGAYTLRLRVTDDLGNEGEDRMQVWVRRPDADAHAGWPQTLPASLESISSKLVDLDGDNKLEIILSTADGQVYAFREDGSVLPGFPVATDPLPALPTCCSPAYDGEESNGEVPVVGSSLIGGVSVGDIDDDGMQEICSGSYDGKVYCWNADGGVQDGFPVSTDIGATRDQYSGVQKPNAKGEPVLVVPALVDFDGDRKLELVAGAWDQKLYVWNSDGTRRAPFPVAIYDPASSSGVSSKRPEYIISVPVVADIDDDGDIEMVFGTNETYGTPNIAGQGGSGRLYAVDEHGSIEPGWPVALPSLSPDAVPLVAEGVGTSPAAADIDGDGTLEIASGLLVGDATVFNHDGSVFATMNGAMGSTGAGGDGDEETAEGGLGKPSDAPVHYYVAHPSFSDVDLDGQVDLMAGTVGNGIAGLAIGSGTPTPFDHYFSVWNAATAAHKPAFPRVVEDWQFFTSASVADVDGAPGGLPEMLVSSGGYWVHAFNALGLEPAGWPKFTGQWVISTPLVGDIDDDGDLEVVVSTRLGNIFVWDMAGDACAAVNDQWRTFHHDEHNTGALGTDTRRPARIDDLSLVLDQGNVVLAWTAPGDDGRCGTAASYELLASDAPITYANASAATPISLPAPQDSGSEESTTFAPMPEERFYAVRAVDEAGNRGPLAQVASVPDFAVRRVRIERSAITGEGSLLVKLQASIDLASLGLIGQTLSVTLADESGPFFTATVEAADQEVRASGTSARFFDRSGTLAEGVRRMRVVSSAAGRSSVMMAAKDVDLSGAAPGPLVVTLELAGIPMTAASDLRAVDAAMTRLVAP
ncbi:MAG TPA: S8 family serine peptidase [Candidatus Limnocylindrales bacterium]|nr:S8 family serine peptidase [Candidatus Limnocylindrales bacterium]